MPQAYRDSSYLSTDNAATETYFSSSDVSREFATNVEDIAADVAVQNEELSDTATHCQVSEIPLKVSMWCNVKDLEFYSIF